MQGVSDKLLEVSEIEDKHACSTLLQTQEALKDVAHPSTLYAVSACFFRSETSA